MADSDASPRRGLTVIVLSLAAIGLLGIPAFFTRSLTDMNYYAHVADKLLNGGMLYRDTMDTKPPFIFLHYALAFRLFGEKSFRAVEVVTLISVGPTAATMFFIERPLFPGARRPETAA